jgi:zinc protease
LLLPFLCLAQESISPLDDKPEPKTSPPAPAIELPVEQYQLENGLTVLLSQDQALPFVATEIVYLVGSSYEQSGRTGFAHLFEHLMFQGSEHFDKEYFSPLEPIGARVNGTTNRDRTNYYEQVPKQYAELPLWLESDRMRSLLPVLTQAKLDNQRDVVKNERRQRYENRPYGMAWWYLTQALYPDSHPYQHSTIGSHEDLSAATLDDVKAFFNKYYVPRNAAIVVVGDFDKVKTKADIEKYFGDMAPGARAAVPSPEPVQLKSIKHWVLEDQVALPKIYLSWPSPALFAPGDAELDLLSSVLTGGKSSRLFQDLVYDQRLAKSIDAYQASMKLGSNYVIEVTAAPGTSIEELEKALFISIKSALQAPPSESELLQARSRYKKGFYQRLESYSSKASLIGSYFLHTGQGDYVQQDFARYESPSATQIIEAGKKFIDLDAYIRIDVLPGDKNAPLKKLEQPSGAAQ